MNNNDYSFILKEAITKVEAGKTTAKTYKLYDKQLKEIADGKRALNTNYVANGEREVGDAQYVRMAIDFFTAFCFGDLNKTLGYIDENIDNTMEAKTKNYEGVLLTICDKLEILAGLMNADVMGQNNSPKKAAKRNWEEIQYKRKNNLPLSENEKKINSLEECEQAFIEQYAKNMLNDDGFIKAGELYVDMKKRSLKQNESLENETSQDDEEALQDEADIELYNQNKTPE